MPRALESHNASVSPGTLQRLTAGSLGLMAHLKLRLLGHSRERRHVIVQSGVVAADAEQPKKPEPIRPSDEDQRIEEALSRFFEVVPDIVGLRRLSDGRFRYVNAEFTRIHGWTREEALTKTIEELGVWANPEQRAQFFRQITADGVVRNFMADFRVRRNTAIEPMLLSAARVELGGEPHVVSVLRNVTDIRRAEQRVRESEARLRAIFDAYLDMIVVTRTGDGRFVYVNPEFSRVTGHSIENILGRSISELDTWPDKEAQRKFSADLMAHGVVRNSEQNFRMSDGRIAPHLISAVLIELDGETHTITMGREITAIKRTEADLVAARERLSNQLDEMRLNQWMLRAEIAEREQAEARLLKSETKLRKVFNASLDAVAIKRLRDDRVIEINPEMVRITGRSQDEFLSAPARSLTLWDDLVTEQRFYRELRTRGEVRNFKAGIRRKDGAVVPCVMSGSTVEIDGEACVVIVCHDNTEVKENERALITAREELVTQVKALRESERQLHAEVVERQKAETRALVGERNLRHVLDTILVTFTINRLSDFVFLDANREFFDRTGYVREETIGHSPYEIGLWPSEDDYHKFHERLVRDGSIRDYVGDFRLKSGSMATMLLSAVKIDYAGERCFVVTARDITDLKSKERQLQAEIAEREQVERRLRESETTLRKVVDASLDAISIRRADDDVYIDANAAFLNLTGYSREEVIGRSLAELRLRADDYAAVFKASMRTRGVVRNMEGQLRRKDGILVPIMTSAVTIDLGNVAAIVAITHDISERKQFEWRQRKSEERLRAIFDANLDAIAVRRLRDDVYREVNREFLRLTGLSRDEVIGHTRDELKLWSPEQRAVHNEILRAAGRVQNFETVLHRKDGTLVPVMSSAVEINLDDEACLLGITRDITQSKEAERELVAAHEAALAASRAKSDFLSSMSHEIRTPMNAILGMADVLAETELDSNQRRYVETMRSNGAALLSIISDILDLAKVESGNLTLERTTFDLSELVERTMETFTIETQEKSVKLVHRIAPDLPRFWVGDPVRLRQILINLVGNAVKFTEQGTITLVVDRDPAHAGGNSKSSAWVRFSIIDTGIGIAPGNIESIFSSFTQADSSISRRYGGTGLGLAIVKRLVDLYGGTLNVTSELGQGSVFTFALPLRIVDAMRAEPPAEDAGISTSPAASAAYPSRRRVLLAEDSADNRLLIRAYLKNSPYDVDEAPDGKAATDKYMAGAYDVVLMDIQMPVMDGHSAVRAIRDWERRKGRGRTPIIALSASVLDEEVFRSLDAGCDSHLSKPVKKNTLIKAIEEVIEAAHGASVQKVANGGEDKEELSAVFRVEVSEHLRLLVPKFLDRKRAEIGQLAAALEMDDFDAIGSLGHRLLGEGGSYGFHRISLIGAGLEEAARMRDHAAAARLHAALSEYLSRVEIVYVGNSAEAGEPSTGEQNRRTL